MIVILLLLARSFAYEADPYRDDWKCWPEGPKTLTYADTGTPLTDISTYIAVGAEWDSWQATNVVAQIILREKMGVTMLQCIGTHPVDGLPCYENWPGGVYDQLETGRMDVNFEAWPGSSALAKVEDRIYASKITDLGALGVRAIEVFITADYDGTWGLGSFKGLKDPAIQAELKADGTVLFNMLKTKLEAGVFMTYSTPWSRPAMKNLDYPDLLATASTIPAKPMVFCIGWNWGNTPWARDLIHDQGLSDIYDIWYFKSEAIAIEFMDKALELKLHYVTYVWEPSYSFGSYQKSLVVGKYPQVPGCDKDGSCDLPAASLAKVGANTIHRVPEVAEFMLRFRFGSNIFMNAIIYDKIANGIDFRDAACNYLKKYTSWEKFVIEIVRYEQTEPWYVIWVQIGCITIAAITLALVTWQVYKCMKPDKGTGQNQNEEIRKEAMMELAMLGYLMLMDITDVIVTCWATATCFSVAGGRPFLIACFCVILVMEFLYNIFITYQRFNLAGAALQFLREGKMDVKLFDAQYTFTQSQAADPRQSLVKLMFSLNYELLTLCAGIGEDLPSIVLYVYMFSEGFLEVSFITGALMSSYSLGWKMSSMEKYGLHKKLNKAMSANKQVGDSDKST